MAKGRRQRPQGRSGSAGGGSGASTAGKVLLGVALGGAATAIGGYLYLHSSPEVVRRQTPAPALERTGIPAETKAAPPRQGEGNSAGVSADRAMIPGVSEPQPPFGASEDVFEAGSAVYLQRCAQCHGTVRRDAAGPNAQRATQLFRAGRTRAAGQTPGQVFAAINLGAQGLGMPAYHGILTDQQIWQVALLLRSAADPLPDPVVAILDGK